jgi:hypothetical protein
VAPTLSEPLDNYMFILDNLDSLKVSQERANMQRCISPWILTLSVCLWLGSSAQAADLEATNTPAPLASLFNHSAHFVIQSNPAPVPGVGHREAFVVARPDISALTQYMYHRCFNSFPEICLSISNDNGATFSRQGTVITQTAGHFAVAPSVARVPVNRTETAWVMVYEEGGSSGGTFWATSPDGRTWSKRGQLFGKTYNPSQPDVYNATPGLYFFNNTAYVFTAQHYNSEGLGLVFFSGPSMTELVQWGGGFVMRGTAAWEAGSVSMPRIVLQNGYHYLFYEGGSRNLGCGATTAQQNVYGWGLARSTDLIHWQKYDWNPIVQSADAESCGFDMPQPFLRGDGSAYVYYTSDDASTVIRDTLVTGGVCSAGSYPNWREKNHQCLPSCGGLGGTYCSHAKSCPSGTTRAGQSWDCASCCR